MRESNKEYVKKFAYRLAHNILVVTSQLHIEYTQANYKFKSIMPFTMAPLKQEIWLGSYLWMRCQSVNILIFVNK